MNAQTRRQEILNTLQKNTAPISATALAQQLGVSRQIIVGDVALLRAAGTEICATPRGYVILRAAAGCTHRLACRHDSSGMADELHIMYESYLHAGGQVPAVLLGSGNGLRKNPHLCRIFEEAFGLPLVLSKNEEEAACGAAIYAASCCK